MKVLVSDTSVLIDLERGGFVEAIFSLPYQFAVPDVLYYGELEGEWGTRLVGLGLLIEETSSNRCCRCPTVSRLPLPRSACGSS